MPYDPKDPRSALAGSSAPKNTPQGASAGMEYLRFYEMEPSETGPGVKTWYGRGQNFILAYTEAQAGAKISRAGQPDEYVLLLPDADSRLEVSTAGEKAALEGHTITFIPPGESSIRFENRTRLVRLFSIRSEDLAAKCPNADSYAQPHPHVAPFQPWPDPKEGYKLRTYPLDVPPEEGRFGRIWRCSTFMVNYLDPAFGPRPKDQMSPHSHDDFEQCSLSLAGAFMHHIRWPWSTDMDTWREDEHELCATPSIAVIPPPAIHTTGAVEEGLNQLVDIFCPPRVDFSNKEGWVLNSEDYPMP
jgi:hypothetical protein